MPSFTNQATLTYQGRTVASNLVTGEMVSPLSITKTALGAHYTARDRVTYVISLVNNGSTCFEDLTLADDLGAYEAAGEYVTPLSWVPESLLYLINGEIQPMPQVTAEPFSVSALQVPAGGTATLIYETQVTQYAPLAAGSQIINTAQVAGPELRAPIRAQAVIRVEEEAELSIAKSLFPTTVEENGVVTYTFTIQNRGNMPAEASDHVILADQFDPVLSALAVTVDGVPAELGKDYTYQDGLFATQPGRITVPAASFSQRIDDGAWQIQPGETVITVSGRL